MANRAGREQTPLQTAASVTCRSPTAPRQVQHAKRDVKTDLCNSKETYINQKRPTVFKLQHLSPAVLQLALDDGLKCEIINSDLVYSDINFRFNCDVINSNLSCSDVDDRLNRDVINSDLFYSGIDFRFNCDLVNFELDCCAKVICDVINSDLVDSGIDDRFNCDLVDFELDCRAKVNNDVVNSNFNDCVNICRGYQKCVCPTLMTSKEAKCTFALECALTHIATHCNMLQHTATHCNTLQHTATHCNTLHHSATHCNMCTRM